MRKRWWLVAGLSALLAGAALALALPSERTVLGSGDPGGERPAIDRSARAGQGPVPAAVVSDAPAADAGDDPPRARKPRRRARFTLAPAPAEPPVRVEFARNPRAGILFDVDTGEVLWERHPYRRLPIASLTKMLTALIIVERHRPGEMVEITPQAVAFEGSGVGVLPAGEEVRLEALLQGLLLVSGNDAAIALAQHDAGLQDFVERMNRWRRRLGLRCSHFTSPHGLQDEGNYSCPRDLATLARADLAERRVRRIVGADRGRFKFPVEGGYLDLYNNNPFIGAGVPGITGVKTGYTDAAGRCYVTTARHGGRHLGVVLLHSPNPLDQVPALLRAGFNAGR
jgi:serine-type D-Ala-D-Ala carboxypeptidase (penicillin-binding protein 5/6)